MKKILFCVLISIAFTSVDAQLANKKWIGPLQLEQATEVTLDFRKDTLDAISNADGQMLETMLFTVKDSILSLKKLYGQSECGEGIIGKYKFQLKDDSISLLLVEDECPSRANILNKTIWNKKK